MAKLPAHPYTAARGTKPTGWKGLRLTGVLRVTDGRRVETTPGTITLGTDDPPASTVGRKWTDG